MPHATTLQPCDSVPPPPASEPVAQCISVRTGGRRRATLPYMKCPLEAENDVLSPEDEALAAERPRSQTRLRHADGDLPADSGRYAYIYGASSRVSGG